MALYLSPLLYINNLLGKRGLGARLRIWLLMELTIVINMIVTYTVQFSMVHTSPEAEFMNVQSRWSFWA
jgi:hypothetical protein